MCVSEHSEENFARAICFCRRLTWKFLSRYTSRIYLNFNFLQIFFILIYYTTFFDKAELLILYISIIHIDIRRNVVGAVCAHSDFLLHKKSIDRSDVPPLSLKISPSARFSAIFAPFGRFCGYKRFKTSAVAVKFSQFLAAERRISRQKPCGFCRKRWNKRL
mgnify:CR=1 FL=1